MRFCVPAMACCLGLGSAREHSGQAPPSILDIEEILQDYVWDFFKTTRPPWQQLCLRRKDFEIHVPMNYFHFDKLREEVRPRQKPLEPSLPGAQPQHSVVAGMTHMPRDVTRNPLTSNANVMALSTDFTNRTDADQTYKFRFEKTRKASLNVTFQRGYTFGGKVNFSLGLPKVVSGSTVGGEVDMHLSVSKAVGETIEETLTWEATSEILVTKTSSYSAKVLLSEAPVSYNFKLWTKMTMPSGAAPVTIRKRPKRGSAEGSSSRRSPGSFRYTYMVSNLQMVFEKYKDMVEMIKEPSANRETVTYAVVFRTTGIIEGVRLADQKILLEGHDLGMHRRSSYPGQSGRGGGGGGGGQSIGGGYVVRNAPYGFGGGGDDYNGSPFPPPPPQEVTSSDGFHGDGFAVVPAATTAPRYPSSLTSLPSSTSSRGGRALHGLTSPLSPPPPPIPMIEEMPEDDVGVEEDGDSRGAVGGVDGQTTPRETPPRETPPRQTPPRQTPPSLVQVSRDGMNCSSIGPPPRITTTPSSQASTPLSECGSPDMSESSKKSETITTV